MKKILSLRPIFIFLGFLGLLFIIIFLIIISPISDSETAVFYIVVISVIYFLAYYFFWIYIIGYGFKELDKKTGNDIQTRRFRTISISAFLSIILSIAINIYFAFIEKRLPPEYMNTLLYLIFSFCYMYIVIKLTNNFKFYDKKETPKIFDYIVTMFLLNLFPFGLLIMHSHLRLLLKERNIK